MLESVYAGLMRSKLGFVSLWVFFSISRAMILNKVKFGLGSFLLSVLIGLFLMSGVTHAQSALDGFDPNVNSGVRSIAVQSDGKLLIGGDFTTVGGTSRNRIARLNTDGTLDTLFNPNANGPVFRN